MDVGMLRLRVIISYQVLCFLLDIRCSDQTLKAASRRQYKCRKLYFAQTPMESMPHAGVRCREHTSDGRQYFCGMRAAFDDWLTGALRFNLHLITEF